VYLYKLGFGFGARLVGSIEIGFEHGCFQLGYLEQVLD
jgi:hypothetical protein